MIKYNIAKAHNLESRKGYKHSTIGWIPEIWEVKEFGELFEFKNGINAGKESYGKGVKFINIMEVIYNDFITAEIIPGSVQISNEHKELYLVEHGDVLFNRTSETTEEIGLTAVYLGKDEVVFGGFVIRGRPINSAIDNHFKKYCFRSKLVRDQIIKSGQGAVRSNIGQSDLGKVKIALPPLLEQKAIADLLNTWDKAITNCRSLIDNCQDLKKWLMQQLLTGKKRLPEFSGEWKEIHLGEVFKERNETGYNNLPLLSVGSSGIYPQSDSIKKDTSNEDKSKYKRILPGDIGYNTMRMWQGRSALSQLEGIVSPAYTIVTAKEGYNAIFFSYLFKLPQTIYSFYSHSQGLVDDTLNCKFHDFATVKVTIPSFTEQTAIANVLQKAEKEITIREQRLAALKEQKKGLMQVLLSGQKRLI